MSLSKPSQYSLNTTSQPRAFQSLSTPRLDTVHKSTAPLSAPPAAGRSPTKPKKLGLVESRRRFVPPAFGGKSPALSITAALHGTLANKKPRKIRTLENSKPKSWFFVIYEESEQVQGDRMNEWTISQSATSLDISDDEGKSKEHSDRGKENIDPLEPSAPVTRSMAAAKVATQELKKDIVVDDARSPLGDLDPVHYYAEGLDATSVVLVQEDAVEEEKVAQAQPAVEQSPAVAEAADFTHPAPIPDMAIDLDTADIGAVILEAQPDWDAETIIEDKIHDEVDGAYAEDIDIWESASAQDENEKQDLSQKNKKPMDDNVFALQEL